MSIILASLGMKVALWIVMILVGLTVLANLASSLRGSTSIGDLASHVTRPVLFDLLPLILLAILTQADPTGVLVLIAYYLAALLIALNRLLQLGDLLRRR
jgi:Na+/phosphate symporter